ncbi:hypothetical protein [Thiolapillus sp.]|uniref:hypothetical protein n=1 Tax=Thiolapillus sp. TaxID=2017437 RepID=UPI003AF8DCB2
MTGRRVRRPTLFSLWRKARRENSAASRLLGTTSLRFALHGWQRKRVFDLVIDFGTSQSPKSTRPLTTYWCPSRPGHPALRNNFASSLLLRTCLPMTGRRVRRPTLFSLWRKARRENSAASRLLGSTSLRFALHGWQRTPRPIAASPVTCRPWQIRDTIRWSPFKWPFRDSSMLIGVSSYIPRVTFSMIRSRIITAVLKVRY